MVRAEASLAVLESSCQMQGPFLGAISFPCQRTGRRHPLKAGRGEANKPWVPSYRKDRQGDGLKRRSMGGRK